MSLTSNRPAWQKFSTGLCGTVLLAAQVISNGQLTATNRPGGLAAQFAHPPAGTRIQKIIHSWPDDPKSQAGLIQRLQQQGFGGVVCNVSFEQYLESDAKWQAFVRAVQQAKEAGMALWLYDERGYPSGNAGGLVLRDHPAWEAQGLLVATQEVGEGSIELSVPPGQIVLATAYPVADGQWERTWASTSWLRLQMSRR